MSDSKDRVAFAALLLAGGCTGQEPTPPAQAVLPLPQGQPVAPTLPEAAKPSVDDSELQGDRPGLAIGEQAPLFEMKDQNGQNRSLTSFLRSGHAALVFYRSADW